MQEVTCQTCCLADDTLVIGVNPQHVGELTAAIERTGSEYGLKLHWGKVQLVRARTTTGVQASDGSVISGQPSMEYVAPGMSR